ncbi:MAG: hypothetical protein H0V89_01125 [Deltaproteobacteria bacterium]|nr:hypothetical protein [Deltaproteobacteria bacterium]
MVLVTALYGCSADEAAEPHEPAVAEAAFEVRVEPEVVAITTGPAGGEIVPFSAFRVEDDGTETPLDGAFWSLSNLSAGELSVDGTFTPSATNGGISWVVASVGDTSGQGTVTVVYEETVNESGLDTSLFDGTPVPVTGLWAYPGDGVSFPRNTPSVHFQWQVASPVGYRLELSSALSRTLVYTTEPGWIADGARWSRITATNAGGSVTATLRAIDDLGRVVEDVPLTLAVNRMDAEGSIIYWSTSESGLVEIPFGGVAAPFLTSAETGHCVGCHVISKGGKVAFTYDGGDGGLGVRDLSDGTDIVPHGSGMAANFKTFSPDDRFLLSTLYGNLTLHDASTGAVLGVARASGDVTMPDWSPDDTQLVVAQSDGHSSDIFLSSHTRLSVLPHLGEGAFGEPVTLHDPPAPSRVCYPSFSPDGEWIVFVVSTGDCYDDPDAELWILDKSGLKPALRLDQLNGGAGLTNSWPRWAPLPDDSVMWIAFSSKRAYGTQVAGIPQLWAAAFDPVVAAAGFDGSYPAFWLPGQNVATGNHIPMWVE